MSACTNCIHNTGKPKGYDRDFDSREFELHCDIYGDIDARNYCDNCITAF